MLTDLDIEFLRNSLPFFDKLTKEEHLLLLQQTKLVSYKKNTTVYDSIKECVGLLIIKKGALRTYILSDQGKDITLYRMHDGDTCTLSASCLLNNITFDVHIDAEEDTVGYVIAAPTFAKIMIQNLYVENFTYKLTLDRFSDVMWTMEQILFMSFDKRLAIFLLDEINHSKSDTITLTHAQIAKYIGSAREVVSRMLKYFESEHILTLFRGGITIQNREKLKALTK